MLVYLYDLKSSVKDYNRLKRNFYYHLNKNGYNQYFWKTKSVLVAPDEMERALDGFFKDFNKFVVAYKIHTDSIEEME
ncbi:hypothetical protein GF412_01965 [Candidatus Micrarchaeota archaeon]|nr:hypothetical protein [Candidatus Micrarchaeota archaeon]MBD3417728.1 hypothetical protein [Candidatus Micrarchaeota archaeon]